MEAPHAVHQLDKRCCSNADNHRNGDNPGNFQHRVHGQGRHAERRFGTVHHLGDNGGAHCGRMMGVNPAMVYSIITTSMAKITPEMGVLNEAEMAAAQPQATRVRMLLLGRRIHWPSRLENAAPRCTAGPSRPADWPLTTVATPATNCTTALRNEM